MLIGNLGNVPEILKETKNGYFVGLSIATTKQYKNAAGNLVKDTQWHKVYASGNQGKFAASYFKKGDRVFIEGELRKRQWTDKKTGEEKFLTAVYASQCQSLMSKPKKEQEAYPEFDTRVDDEILREFHEEHTRENTEELA